MFLMAVSVQWSAVETPPLWTSAHNADSHKGFGTRRVPHSHSDPPPHRSTFLVPHTNVCTISPPAGRPPQWEDAADVPVPVRSGAVVCRSADGRLRGPRSWWGGPARRQPDQTQAADAMALTWRRTEESQRTRPRLSPTFHAGAEPLADCAAPLELAAPSRFSWLVWPDLPGACNSSPDTDGARRPRKSLTMRGL